MEITLDKIKQVALYIENNWIQTKIKHEFRNPKRLDKYEAVTFVLLLEYDNSEVEINVTENTIQITTLVYKVCSKYGNKHIREGHRYHLQHQWFIDLYNRINKYKIQDFLNNG